MISSIRHPYMVLCGRSRVWLGAKSGVIENIWRLVSRLNASPHIEAWGWLILHTNSDAEGKSRDKGRD